MASRRPPEPNAVRRAVEAVAEWLLDETAPEPERCAVGAAVRVTARALAATAPGSSVEVRVPPFVAVQCIPGVRHTRGTPPNVVETDARTWLLLATGLVTFEVATEGGPLRVSGARAGEIARWFPLVKLDSE